MIFCHLQIFLKINFFEIFFTIRVPNSLDFDQAQRFVGPDLGPNCLQRSSADDTSRQRVKKLVHFFVQDNFCKLWLN